MSNVVIAGMARTPIGGFQGAFSDLTAAMLGGAALLGWLNPRLGKHERVVAVEVRESLPKTLVGKLSRKELVAEERARSEGGAALQTIPNPR